MSTSDRVLHVQKGEYVPGFIYAQLPADFRLGMHKYSAEVYEACVRSFEALPIAALIDSKFFCVHGGISPHLVHISDLDSVRGVAKLLPRTLSYFPSTQIDRFVEPPSQGLLCDLLWSDPVEDYGREVSGPRIPTMAERAHHT